MRCLLYIMAAMTLGAADSAAQGAKDSLPPKPGAVVPERRGQPGRPPSSAQNPDSGTPKFDTGAGAGNGEKSPPPLHTLSQFVRFSDGRPVKGATVIASSAGVSAAGPAHVATTDSVGRFTIDSLHDGNYDLTVSYPGAVQPLIKRVTVDGRSTGDILVPATSRMVSAWALIGILVFYLLTIMLVRWHNIARSLEEMLKGQLSALQTRLVTEVDQTKAAEKKQLTDTIDEIRKSFIRPDAERWKNPLELMLWSRGRENAAWVAIHEIERQIAAFLAPPERVVSYLQLAHAQLRVINTPPAIAIAEAIRASLPSKPGEATTDTQNAERKALLGHAIALCYQDRDNEFATLMEWHNKASWLILAALIIIGSVALAAGHAILFLAGAAGGFLSRVMRALRREDIPLDYGASWTTLFLSPLFGALAGWFGVAIITLATQPNVNLLGAAFKVVEWDNPFGPATLAVAFLLGFSERLFDAVVGAVERHAAVNKAAEEAVRDQGTAPLGGQGSAPVKPDEPPPSSAGGVKILLPDGQLTVATVSGSVVLDKPRTAATGVTLSTSRKDFEAVPAALTIAAGEVEGHFDIVPKGNAPPGEVRVTAKIGEIKVSDSIKFT